MKRAVLKLFVFYTVLAPLLLGGLHTASLIKRSNSSGPDSGEES